MDNNIKQILDELYQLDPELKNYSLELEKIIITMLKAKPNTNFDENFKAELKAQLLARAAELKKQEPMKAVSLWQNTRLWQVFTLTTVTAAIALLLVFPTLLKPAAKTPKLAKNTDVQSLELFSTSTGISSLSDQAFGSLSLSESASSGASNVGISPAAPVADGIGGGRESLNASDKMSLIYPEMFNYKFNYQGEEIKIEAEKLPVLKRLKGTENKDFSSWLKSLNLGLIDSSQLKNLQVSYLSFVENKDFGFQVDITPLEGGINITENWLKWPHSYSDQNLALLTINDVPDDEVLKGIADNFLKQFKVDMKNYGPGEVDHEWRGLYAQAATADQGAVYIPDTITVRYPYLVDGKEVFEQGGVKNGLFVNVNIYAKKASGLYGLFTRKYESSDYAVEKDTQRIMKIVNQGGLFGGYNAPEAEQTVEVTLGTPTLAYMAYWKAEANTNQEFLVPAYIFPVVSVSQENTYYNKFIVVPIIKEILDSYDSAQYPVPMPLTEPTIQAR